MQRLVLLCACVALSLALNVPHHPLKHVNEDADLEMNPPSKQTQGYLISGGMGAASGGLIGAMVGGEDKMKNSGMGGLIGGVSGLLASHLSNSVGSGSGEQGSGSEEDDSTSAEVSVNYGPCLAAFEHDASAEHCRMEEERVVHAFSDFMNTEMKTLAMAFADGEARKAMLFAGLGAETATVNPIMKHVFRRAKSQVAYLCKAKGSKCAGKHIKKLSELSAKAGSDHACVSNLAKGEHSGKYEENGMMSRYKQQLMAFSNTDDEKFLGKSRRIGAAIATCMLVAQRGAGGHKYSNAELEALLKKFKPNELQLEMLDLEEATDKEVSSTGSATVLIDDVEEVSSSLPQLQEGALAWFKGELVVVVDVQGSQCKVQDEAQKETTVQSSALTPATPNQIAQMLVLAEPGDVVQLNKNGKTGIVKSTTATSAKIELFDKSVVTVKGNEFHTFEFPPVNVGTTVRLSTTLKPAVLTSFSFDKSTVQVKMKGKKESMVVPVETIEMM